MTNEQAQAAPAAQEEAKAAPAAEQKVEIKKPDPIKSEPEKILFDQDEVKDLVKNAVNKKIEEIKTLSATLAEREKRLAEVEAAANKRADAAKSKAWEATGLSEKLYNTLKDKITVAEDGSTNVSELVGELGIPLPVPPKAADAVPSAPVKKTGAPKTPEISTEFINVYSGKRPSGY